jgi:hypothetical protein
VRGVKHPPKCGAQNVYTAYGIRGGIDKNLRKNISSNINLKYGSCRYVHAE